MDCSHQDPLSMGCLRQEYWNGLPFSSPGDLPSPGIEPVSPALAGRFFITEPLGKPLIMLFLCLLPSPNFRPCHLASVVEARPLPLSVDHHFAAAKLLSHVQLFATPWTLVQQAPLSMEFCGSCIKCKFFTAEPQGKPKPPLYTSPNSKIYSFL